MTDPNDEVVYESAVLKGGQIGRFGLGFKSTLIAADSPAPPQPAPRSDTKESEPVAKEPARRPRLRGSAGSPSRREARRGAP